MQSELESKNRSSSFDGGVYDSRRYVHHSIDGELFSRIESTTSENAEMKMSVSRPSTPCDQVYFALTSCSLGWLVVAATDRGVCFTSLGDTPEAVRQRLLGHFPAAEDRDDAKLARWMKRIVASLESPAKPCDVPLDIQGTVFQRLVWDALRAIPAGSTASYAEIARRIGRPKAVRAVGHACGSNPVVPVIPCHRVLRSDGTLGGYGFGLDRKRMLLSRENVALPAMT